MTFILITISILYVRSFKVCPPLLLLSRWASSIHFSCMLIDRPFIVSCVVHWNICLPFSRHIFLSAASFHCVCTACLGVTSDASLHGADEKSIVCASSLPIIKERSIFICSVFTVPHQRCCRKSCQTGSDILHCSFSSTTVVNSLYIARPIWEVKLSLDKSTG